jgi:hypothetical protein
LDDAQVRVISAAINLAPLDASVSITGAAIEFNAASSATATANAVIDSNLSDANATITSIASANSGNAIKTNAIGAVNDSTVDIQNDFAFLRTNDFDLTGTGYEGDAEEAATVAGIGALASGLGGFITAQGLLGQQGLNGDSEFYDNEPPVDVAVFQAAYNTGDINANVIIAAADTDSSYYSRGVLGNLSISDLSISTTAIGAVNSGAVNVVQTAIVDVKTSTTFNVADVTNTVE